MGLFVAMETFKSPPLVEVVVTVIVTRQYSLSLSLSLPTRTLVSQRPGVTMSWAGRDHQRFFSA